MRYETEGMAEIRRILTATLGSEHPFTDADVDTFKQCLSFLERKGFTLTRKG